MITSVKTTYLEMLNQEEFVPKSGYREKIQIMEVQNEAFVNLVMFLGVGLPWKWYSRLIWTENDWNNYLKNSKSKLFLGFQDKKLIGYYELEFQYENQVKIKFFGLLPGNFGSGFGGMLLSRAVECAWQNNTKRVWVHTCSLDSEYALNNYKSRGFKVYKESIDLEDVPDKNQLMQLISGFFERYFDRHSMLKSD